MSMLVSRGSASAAATAATWKEEEKKDVVLKDKDKKVSSLVKQVLSDSEDEGIRSSVKRKITKAAEAAPIKRQRIEPISLEEAKGKVQSEISSLLEAYKGKLTPIQKIKTNAYMLTLNVQLGICGSKEKLIDLLKGIEAKLEWLKEGQKPEEVKKANSMIKEIKLLQTRLAV